jgi:hypothetical protein
MYSESKSCPLAAAALDIYDIRWATRDTAVFLRVVSVYEHADASTGVSVSK